MALRIGVSQQPNVPLINGRGYSHQSIAFKIDGIDYKFGLVSLNYKTSLNPQPLKSTQARPVGYTLGTLEESGDFELYTQWGKALLKQLGAGYGQGFHTITAQKSEVDDSGVDDAQTDVLVARIKTVDQGSSGDNALTMKFELVIGKMTINGVDIVAQGR